MLAPATAAIASVFARVSPASSLQTEALIRGIAFRFRRWREDRQTWAALRHLDDSQLKEFGIYPRPPDLTKRKFPRPLDDRTIRQPARTWHVSGPWPASSISKTGSCAATAVTASSVPMVRRLRSIPNIAHR